MVIVTKGRDIIELRQKITDLSKELYSLANAGQTPRCRMFLETSAEVMTGINQAFDCFLTQAGKN